MVEVTQMFLQCSLCSCLCSPVPDPVFLSVCMSLFLLSCASVTVPLPLLFSLSFCPSPSVPVALFLSICIPLLLSCPSVPVLLNYFSPVHVHCPYPDVPHPFPSPLVPVFPTLFQSLSLCFFFAVPLSLSLC